ncbi:MAG: PaaI family thioesterase [Cryobacterium sp.]|nr:PaaI family thioesterase [Oligoflexia bacterium]
MEPFQQTNAPGLQDRFSPEGHCFGCGPKNLKGLQIKSHAVDLEDGSLEVRAIWHAEPHHEAFPGMLNGGIIGSLLDCHSNWTAAEHLRRAGNLDAPPCTVTSDFHVTLKRPTPSNMPIYLRARVKEAKEDRALIEATLEAGGKICATCTGTFVAVKPGHPAYHRW